MTVKDDPVINLCFGGAESNKQKMLDVENMNAANHK